MSDLFPDAPRRSRRTLLRVVDVDGGCCDSEPPFRVSLRCPKCAFEMDGTFNTTAETRRVPCPVCNTETADA